MCHAQFLAFSMSFLMIFSAGSHARKIELDDVTNAKLLKQDSVERTIVDSYLVEKHRDDATKEWIIKFTPLISSDQDTPNLESIEELRSGQILGRLEDLVGKTDISLAEINNFEVSPDLSRVLFYFSHDLFIYSRVSHDVDRMTHTGVEKDLFQFSPNGLFVAYVEGNNLWVADLTTKQTRQLTVDGNENVLNGKLDWVYQEEIFGRGDYRGFWWSPDSSRIAFLRTDETPVKRFPLVDDSEVYGDLRQMPYPKAGFENPLVDIGIVHVNGGIIQWVDLSAHESSSSLIVGVDFTKDSALLLYQVQNRIQSTLHINIHDVVTGQGATLWFEEDLAWVNRLQDVFVHNGYGFYFLSEKGGLAQIFFFDFHENRARQITKENLEIKEILGVSGDYLYFAANENSLFEDQLFSLNGKTGELSRLLSVGQHHEASISRDGRFMIATSQSHLLAPEKRLFALNGSTATPLRSLYQMDTAEFQQLDLQQKDYLMIENRRGQKMHALLFLPTDFDHSKKYPLMTFVYCGPKSPSVKNRFMLSFELWHHYLAQKGNVVLMMDCYSANSIGHEGESMVYKRLGVAELEDIEDGVNHLLERGFIDKDRLGIWGWSYGGFMTSLAMTRTNMFNMGVAVAPVTDWQLYDTVYTERYMCTPSENADGYKTSCVLERAEALSGNLLLVHGAMDDNVHQQNSLNFAHKVQMSGKTTVQQVIYLKNDHSLLGVRKHLFSTMEQFVDGNL